jgi:8-oxo-dGTP pyrophosphatase MutT (NUDIX family)
MNFDVFFKAIPTIVDLELPATSAHIKMAPLERIKILEVGFENAQNARQAAVMMLFYPKQGITHLALILRNSYPGVHASQIAFPGGKVEEVDLDLKGTALRETFEEIGVHADKINVIREFSSVYIPPSNFMVFPFLGITESELEFTLQEDEVAGIIEVPLSLLLDDSIVLTKEITTSYANLIDVPVFQFGDHAVWGATAMMLSELKEALKMVF